MLKKNDAGACTGISVEAWRSSRRKAGQREGGRCNELRNGEETNDGLRERFTATAPVEEECIRRSVMRCSTRDFATSEEGPTWSAGQRPGRKPLGAKFPGSVSDSLPLFECTLHQPTPSKSAKISSRDRPTQRHKIFKSRHYHNAFLAPKSREQAKRPAIRSPNRDCDRAKNIDFYRFSWGFGICRDAR
jgi:hypothetical protein